MGYLPGVVGCLARRVVLAVGGGGGDRASRLHAWCGLPTVAEVGPLQRWPTLGGCLPLAGCRVAVTLMYTALAGSGGAGGGGLSRQVEVRAAFADTGSPCGYYTQWLWNFAQALFCGEGLGCSLEACSALSCSYCTRAATLSYPAPPPLLSLCF